MTNHPLTTPAFISSGDALAEGVNVGGKARALARLGEAGFPVPTWFAVLPAAAGTPDWERALAARVREDFPLGTRLAVRSSAADEDGADFSFAGQLDSFLNVQAEEAAARVADVWRSGSGERARAYRRGRGLPEAGAPPAVIVQRMVAAAAAGVAFGADPVSGRRGVAVVSAVRGLGDKLVSGEADAETWEVVGEKVQDASSKLQERGKGEAARTEREAVLTEAQVLAAAELARRAGEHFGTPQDVEWAFDAEGKLWLLQSRPITGLGALPEADGPLAVWDNANIAESYGGVTTPLTFSFARRGYEAVYREFCRLLGVPERKIKANAGTFARMLGLIQGRVYYNLLNWYRVLALLPGYRINRGFMEGMMGVREGLPAEAAETLEAPDAPGKVRDALALARSLCGLAWSAWRLPRQTRAFYARLDDALREPSPPLALWRADELAAYYLRLEGRLLTRWDAPLVNDFFAMIAFGALRKLAARWCGDTDGSLANALLARTGGIVSAEPARLVRAMSLVAARTPPLAAALREGGLPEIEAALREQPELAALCAAYLARFGDRCLEELKLETPTLHDEPLMLYRAIGRGAAAGGVPPAPSPASPAGPEDKAAAGPWGRRWVFGWVLRRARARVRGRENLRFERTRVFGRARRIFVELGRRLQAAGRLAEARDIFYLTVEEVLGFVDGTAAATDLRGLTALRRAEFDAHRRAPAPPDRFETRGAVHLGNRFEASAAASQPEAAQTGDERRGLGCCAGRVRGRARVVLDPRAAEVRPGEILVARRTDPGWVLLFPAAAGLVVEHGSLLSHSAIVARELGLPAVVSVPGAAAWLQTGDLVEMDGAAGWVRRVGRNDE